MAHLQRLIDWNQICLCLKALWVCWAFFFCFALAFVLFCFAAVFSVVVVVWGFLFDWLAFSMRTPRFFQGINLFRVQIRVLLKSNLFPLETSFK